MDEAVIESHGVLGGNPGVVNGYFWPRGPQRVQILGTPVPRAGEAGPRIPGPDDQLRGGHFFGPAGARSALDGLLGVFLQNVERILNREF
jgi:hypothetical protein